MQDGRGDSGPCENEEKWWRGEGVAKVLRRRCTYRFQFYNSENKKQTLYLVIMNNVFKDFTVSEFFDLKGSTQGRNLMRPNEPLEVRVERYGKTAMKDIDFLRFRTG